MYVCAQWYKQIRRGPLSIFPPIFNLPTHPDIYPPHPPLHVVYLGRDNGVGQEATSLSDMRNLFRQPTFKAPSALFDCLESHWTQWRNIREKVGYQMRGGGEKYWSVLRMVSSPDNELSLKHSTHIRLIQNLHLPIFLYLLLIFLISLGQWV